MGIGYSSGAGCFFILIVYEETFPSTILPLINLYLSEPYKLTAYIAHLRTCIDYFMSKDIFI